MFSWTDAILLVLLAGFATTGFILGLIQAVGALIGLAAGIFLATAYYQPLATWLTPILFGHSVAATITAFLVIFFLANRLVGLIFWLLGKIFGVISWLPFIKPINRLAGLVLGVIEGILLLGVSVFVVAKFSQGVPWLYEPVSQSRVAHWLVLATQFLVNFLPQ